MRDRQALHVDRRGQGGEGVSNRITRKSRQSGTHITVVHANDCGLELEPGHTVWYTICEEHDQCTDHPNYHTARAWAAEPLTWCEVCNGSDSTWQPEPEVANFPQRIEQHANLTKGDIVKVAGIRGIFEVVYVDIHDAERPAEVTIIGGVAGKRAWRTIIIDRIKKQTRAKGGDS